MRQCRGKENDAVVDKYMPYVVDFIRKSGLQLREFPSVTGLVMTGGDDGRP